MPQHVIDKLWTTNLDVNIFCECKHFIKSKCDASLDFPSLMQMLPTKMQMFIWCTCLLTNIQMQIFMMQISHYRDANTISLRCKFPCRDVNAKSIHDDANAPLRRCKCKSLFFDIKMPLAGMSWCKYPLWVCHDANAFYLTQMQFNQKFILFPIRGFLESWNLNAFKARFILSKSHHFFW